MQEEMKLKIEMLESDQLRDYFPEDSFFTMYDLRFGQRKNGKSLLRQLRELLLPPGREISLMEKKEILASTQLSVLRICFVNESGRTRKFGFPYGPFRVDRIDPIISDLSGKRIESRQIFWGKYKRADPVIYELQPDEQLCFDLVGFIDGNKLVFPCYEYELQHGTEYLIQIGDLNLRTNQIRWWFA